MDRPGKGSALHGHLKTLLLICEVHKCDNPQSKITIWSRLWIYMYISQPKITILPISQLRKTRKQTVVWVKFQVHLRGWEWNGIHSFHVLKWSWRLEPNTKTLSCSINFFLKSLNSKWCVCVCVCTCLCVFVCVCVCVWGYVRSREWPRRQTKT